MCPIYPISRPCTTNYGHRQAPKASEGALQRSVTPHRNKKLGLHDPKIGSPNDYHNL